MSLPQQWLSHSALFKSLERPSGAMTKQLDQLI